MLEKCAITLTPEQISYLVVASHKGSVTVESTNLGSTVAVIQGNLDRQITLVDSKGRISRFR